MINREVRYFNSHKKVGQRRAHGVQQDYHQKKMHNPFQHHRANLRQNENVRRFKVTCILIIILFLTLGWFLFFSRTFSIQTVNVSGLTRTNADEIKKIVWDQTTGRRYLLFTQNNLFMFDKKKIAATLKDQYNFQDIKIKRRLFNSINVIVKERAYAFVWGEQNKYYYLDQAGNLIGEIPLVMTPVTLISTVAMTSTAATTTATSTVSLVDDQEIIKQLKKIATDYPIIKNEGDDKLIDKKVDLEDGYFAFISRLFTQIKTNNDPGITVREFIVGKEFNTIKVILDNNLTIYFSTKEDWDKQINNLFVLKKELNINFNKLIKQKIDLRYGDKVYYE